MRLSSDHSVEITTTVDAGELWRAIVEYAGESDINHIIRTTVETTTHHFR